MRERQHQLDQGGRQRIDVGQKGNRKGLLIAAMVLLGLGMLGSNWLLPEDDSDDRSGMVTQDRPRGAVTIEAEQLYQAYRDDPDGSEERFDGREMVVSGEFLRIVPDGYGSLDLRLKTSNPGVEVGVDLAQLAIEDGRSLRPGQRVTLSCQQMGGGGDEIWVQDCAIQPTAETVAPAAASAAANPLNQ